MLKIQLLHWMGMYMNKGCCSDWEKSLTHYDLHWLNDSISALEKSTQTTLTKLNVCHTLR